MQVSVKENRDKYIGGSDIPIIMNISPFKSRFDLLLEKAGLKEDDFEGNQYTEYGNVMEDKIRNHINNMLGKSFKEGKHIEGDIRCHTDGEDSVAILEIKTTSQVYDNVDDYETYLVQLLFYMVHTNKSAGFLAVYNRPEDFSEEFDEKRLKLFGINIDNYKDLIEEINNAVDKFREDLEKVKANPLITEEELQPMEVIDISNKLVALEIKLKEYKELETEQKNLKVQLKEAMEKYHVDKWTTNNGTKITLVPDGIDEEIKSFNEDKFKEENQDIYEKYLDTKIKKGRSGYVKITLPKD